MEYFTVDVKTKKASSKRGDGFCSNNDQDNWLCNGDTGTITIKPNKGYSIKGIDLLAAPEREDFVFAGWETEMVTDEERETGEEKEKEMVVFQPGGRFEVTAARSFTALWIAEEEAAEDTAEETTEQRAYTILNLNLYNHDNK